MTTKGVQSAGSLSESVSSALSFSGPSSSSNGDTGQSELGHPHGSDAVDRSDASIAVRLEPYRDLRFALNEIRGHIVARVEEPDRRSVGFEPAHRRSVHVDLEVAEYRRQPGLVEVRDDDRRR